MFLIYNNILAWPQAIQQLKLPELRGVRYIHTYGMVR